MKHAALPHVLIILQQLPYFRIQDDLCLSCIFYIQVLEPVFFYDGILIIAEDNLLYYRLCLYFLGSFSVYQFLLEISVGPKFLK